MVEPYGPVWHQPSDSPFDPSFWYITPSMGFPEGTKAGGYGTPFEEAELVLIKYAYNEVKSWFNRKTLGTAMIVWGTAMAVPGPVDFAAGAAGVALLRHPIGAPLGVGAYNLFAYSVISAGGYLLAS